MDRPVDHRTLSKRLRTPGAVYQSFISRSRAGSTHDSLTVTTDRTGDQHVSRYSALLDLMPGDSERDQAIITELFKQNQ